MKIIIEEILPIKPNILRVKAYTVTDEESETPHVTSYELAVHTQDFVERPDSKTVQINLDKFRNLITSQLSELQDTANLAAALEHADLEWDVTIQPKEEQETKKGKKLAFEKE